MTVISSFLSYQSDPKPFITDIFKFFHDSTRILDILTYFLDLDWCPLLSNTVKNSDRVIFCRRLSNFKFINRILEEQSVFILLTIVDKIKSFTQVVLGKPKRISPSTGIKLLLLLRARGVT